MMLTDWERTFLLDRLGADVVPGVLVDTYDCAEADAEAAVEAVTTAVTNGEINPDIWNYLEREALRDAIDGSTWFARLSDAVDDGEKTHQAYSADWRRMQNLRMNLGVHGLDVGPPAAE